MHHGTHRRGRGRCVYRCRRHRGGRFGKLGFTARPDQGRDLHGNRPATCAPPGDPLLPELRHRISRRRLWRVSRQAAVRLSHKPWPHFPHAQTPVQRYMPKLLQLIEEGRIDPSFVITHIASLEQGPDLYKTFRDKEDGCIKVVLKPGSASAEDLTA